MVNYVYLKKLKVFDKPYFYSFNYKNTKILKISKYGHTQPQNYQLKPNREFNLFFKKLLNITRLRGTTSGGLKKIELIKIKMLLRLVLIFIRE